MVALAGWSGIIMPGKNESRTAMAATIKRQEKLRTMMLKSGKHSIIDYICQYYVNLKKVNGSKK